MREPCTQVLHSEVASTRGGEFAFYPSPGSTPRSFDGDVVQAELGRMGARRNVCRMKSAAGLRLPKLYV